MVDGDPGLEQRLEGGDVPPTAGCHCLLLRRQRHTRRRIRDGEVRVQLLSRSYIQGKKCLKKSLAYRIAGNFGGLAVYITTVKLKSAKISYLHIIRMAILYRTAKFKSTNILAIGSTTKFNSRQYFRLYSIPSRYSRLVLFSFTLILGRVPPPPF